MIKEFRDFIMRGNVIDLAVALIIGAAFGAIVTSLVADIIMPPIGLALGKVDFVNLFLVLKDGTKTAGPYASLEAAKAAGAVTINYGVFITRMVAFLIVAFVVFMIIKAMATIKPRQAVAPTTKECPFCLSVVPLKATRCPNCTSQLS